MGLIAAGLGAVGGVLADQWKEFFYCDAIDKDILAVKGKHRVTGRSSNTKGNDNIISSGSVIAVADGQCMIIVEQGKIVEVCAEPGEFIWDASTEPSIFTGKLSTSIKNTFKLIGKRFTFGGDPGKDQRIYYFNTKEIVENKFGTPTPIPFRVVDKNINLDIDVSVRCSGLYSYRIADPLLFYANVCGNVERDYSRSEIDAQLKTEFISALQPAFARISDLQVRPSALPGHAEELSEAMNVALSKKWGELRGLEVVSIAMNPITLSEEDQELIKKAQHAAIMRDPTMAAATLVEAQSQAMKDAAKNSGGAMTGFMGYGMAQQAGGVNAGNLFAMGQQQAVQQPAPAPAPSADTWKCTCGAENTGKFCMECGAAKPAAPEGWTCPSCGTVNKGKFCMECGAKKPAGAPLYRCDKCGWEPEDPAHPPKFCPECGDRFDENDIQ
ncbi:MAG: SPFH domain-containing protein [Oscillospiraceae bacterium]|nr:SPFH domain-containing protein [Oscillospiraceae bacterium]